MRIVMWSKWATNLVLLAVVGVLVLMVYWQHKLVSLEEQQKSFGAKLGLVSSSDSQSSHPQQYESAHQAAGQPPVQPSGKSNLIPRNISPKWTQGRDDHGDNLVIIYNRIPKTGSTSFIGVAYDLCSKNSFRVVHFNTTKNSHILSPADQIRFSQNATGWLEKRPTIYHGHFGYTEFNALGVSLRPIYINVVRNPLDRLISYYYFLRYGDNFRPEVVRKRKGDTESFDDCVSRKGDDCDPQKLWMQIPFFCGTHAACWEPGNAWALQQAKSNLARSYFLVGVTENLEDFVAVLEASLPRIFKNALSVFNSGGRSHLRQTYGKLPPSRETTNEFHKSKIWQMEQDFYMFAKKNFNYIRKRFLSHDSNDGTPLMKQMFKYEKIRPRS